MKHSWQSIFGIAIITLWALAACPLQAKDIIIATSSMTLTSVPYLVAIEKGFFERRTHGAICRDALGLGGQGIDYWRR